MEQTNFVVITKKEGKQIKSFKRVCEILGYDLSKIASLEQENDLLKEEISKIRKENEKLIQEKMTEIAVNIQKTASVQNAVNQAKQFGFKGKTIDETF